MFNGGYKGKILRIDLTHESVVTELLDEAITRAYIGGRGIGTYLAYSELAPNLDPFSPESSVYFMTGPLQGTLTPFASKFAVINKSPLSGSLSRSVCGGGGFGPAVKYAGYDMLIIKGIARKPVYIWIDDDTVQIRDAQSHWGKTTEETKAAIRKELKDSSVSVAPIGPAGEKLVRFRGLLWIREQQAEEAQVL